MRTLFLLLLFAFPLLANAQTYIRKGQRVSGRWTLENSPYIIKGEIQVPKNKQLIVEAGVIVKLQPSVYLNYDNPKYNSGIVRVQGKLIAEGTHDKPVLFTKHDGKGWWGMILIDKGGRGEFDHCIIEHGQAVIGLINAQRRVSGALTFYRSSGMVRNSIIRRNGYSGVLCYKSEGVKLIGNDIIGNRRGIDAHENSSPHIEGNLIADNFESGIDIQTMLPFQILSNTITKNGLGLGASGQHNNLSRIEVMDCIIYGNKTNLSNHAGRKRFSYSLIQAHGLSEEQFISITKAKNLFEHKPKFFDPENGNYGLKPNSPCLNNGSVKYCLLTERGIQALREIPTRLKNADVENQYKLDTIRLKTAYLDSLRSIAGKKLSPKEMTDLLREKLGALAGRIVDNKDEDIRLHNYITLASAVRNTIGAKGIYVPKPGEATDPESEQILTDDVTLPNVLALDSLAHVFEQANHFRSAIDKHEMALAMKQKLLQKAKRTEREDLRRSIAFTQGKLGAAYFYTGYHDRSLQHYEAILKNEKVIDKASQGRVLSNIGFVYEDMGRYDKAVEYFEKVVAIQRKVKNWGEVAKGKFKVGDINYKTGDFTKSVDEFEDVLSLEKKHKIENEQGASLNNIGAVYTELMNYDEAANYLKRAVRQHKTDKDTLGLSISYNNLGNVEFHAQNFEKAAQLYHKSVEIKERYNNMKGLAITFHNLANLYLKQEKFTKAEDYYLRSNKNAQAVHLDEITLRNYAALSRLRTERTDCDDVVKTLLEYAEKQFLFNKDAMKQIAEFQAKFDLEFSGSMDKLGMDQLDLNRERQITHVSIYKREIARQKRLALLESAKKEKEIKLLSAQVKLHQTEAEAQKALSERLYMVLGSLLMLILVIVYAVFRLTRANAEKKKANQLLMQKNSEIQQQKEEIETQRDSIVQQNNMLKERNEEIEAQRNHIELANTKLETQAKDILDSINYAQRIQEAIMPTAEQLQETFREHFVFFRPRDVVSGDFYWMKSIKNFTVFAAADCTGHGVPGAFMSMLGISFLNEIVTRRSFDSAGLVLDRLREKVKEALHQTGKEGEQRDGMDIALLVIDHEAKELQFSGAYNPLLIAVNGELKQLKADRQPIGIHLKETPFTTQTYKVNPSETLYIFSDGFMDQLGGTDQKKYMSKRFKNFLLQNHNLPMPAQEQRLAEELELWRGETEQVDDVLVVGIRLG